MLRIFIFPAFLVDLLHCHQRSCFEDCWEVLIVCSECFSAVLLSNFLQKGIFRISALATSVGTMGAPCRSCWTHFPG